MRALVCRYFGEVIPISPQSQRDAERLKCIRKNKTQRTKNSTTVRLGGAMIVYDHTDGLRHALFLLLPPFLAAHIRGRRKEMRKKKKSKGENVFFLTSVERPAVRGEKGDAHTHTTSNQPASRKYHPSQLLDRHSCSSRRREMLKNNGITDSEGREIYLQQGRETLRSLLSLLLHTDTQTHTHRSLVRHVHKGIFWLYPIDASRVCVCVFQYFPPLGPYIHTMWTLSERGRCVC